MAATGTRVACIQFAPIVGDLVRNRTYANTLVRDAAANGAEIVVLPELSNSGYVFQSREEALECSEEVGGETIQLWLQTAREANVYVAAGFAERAGDRLYNSACLLTPAGDVHLYRKNHLYFEENLFFSLGDLGFPVFDLPFGRVGLLVCYDSSFPESYRELALAGAQLVLLPTNWGASHGIGPYDMLSPVQMNCIVAARSYGLFVAAADRIGLERGRLFRGGSLIVQAGGRVLAGPVGTDEQIIYATCDMGNMEQYYQTTPYNHIWKDRRTDLYG